MDNPETRTTLGTRHKRDNQKWTIQKHGHQWAPDTEGESRIDNPETQTTSVTRHRRGNQEWTIQRHRQNWALDTEGAIKNGQSSDTGNIGH